MSEAPTTTNKPFGTLVKIVTTAVLLLFLGGGVYLTQRGLKSVEQSIASRDWPTVEGEIVRWEPGKTVHIRRAQVGFSSRSQLRSLGGCSWGCCWDCSRRFSSFRAGA